MTDTSLAPAGALRTASQRIWRNEKPWIAVAAILLVLLATDAYQAVSSAQFAVAALIGIAPYLFASILIAAWAGATGADALIARAFTGAPAAMILMGALAGGLSPFCSCGVIPLIAALLAIGVPLAPVMAFWLASPLMDPSMFALTTGVLGLEFAIAKTLIAVGMGVFGGTVVHLAIRAGGLPDPLRPDIGNGGCGGAKVRTGQSPVWRFWSDPARLVKFRREGVRTTLFLGKWLALAFVLESLMLAYVPAVAVAALLGGNGIQPILIATFADVPAYFNGYAALPLIGTLMAQGMEAGAGMAFLIAGGVTSLPAAVAVWALVRPRVFALYVALSLSGAFAAGLAFQVWMAI